MEVRRTSVRLIQRTVSTAQGAELMIIYSALRELTFWPWFRAPGFIMAEAKLRGM
jgi:hypothetical protein